MILFKLIVLLCPAAAAVCDTSNVQWARTYAPTALYACQARQQRLLELEPPVDTRMNATCVRVETST